MCSPLKANQTLVKFVCYCFGNSRVGCWCCFLRNKKTKTELEIFLETSAMAIYNVLVYLECLLVWTFKTKHRFYQD